MAVAIISSVLMGSFIGIIVIFQMIISMAMILEENLRNLKSEIHLQKTNREKALNCISKLINKFDMATEHEFIRLIEMDECGYKSANIERIVKEMQLKFPEFKESPELNRFLIEYSLSDNLARKNKNSYNKEVKQYYLLRENNLAKLILTLKDHKMQEYAIME